MITQHWRLLLHRDHIAVSLFTTTTGEMVKRDLSQPAEHSLIRMARQYHRRAQTDEQNLRDLAIGALMTYAPQPIYNREDCHIERVNGVPAREPNDFVGGSPNSRLVPVWEEATQESRD